MKIQEFDYIDNVTDSILWQYNNSTNLLTLINNKQTWLSEYQTTFWTDWYNQVFNLATTTPTLFGMVVWSIILNVPLFIPFTPESNNKPIWGFNAFDPSFPTYENSYLNFGHSNFSTRGQYISLTIAEQQFLLRLRYFQLCNLTDIDDINTFLNYLCANNQIGYTGTIYVVDYLQMDIAYVFTNADFPDQLYNAIIELDLFPRPAGVGIDFILYGQPVWGFGIFNQNFTNGNFLQYL